MHKIFYSTFLLIGVGLILLPSVDLGILYTHGIGKLILITLFIIHVAKNAINTSLLRNSEFFLILLVLMSASVSITYATDIEMFIRRYLDIVYSVLAYLLVYYYARNYIDFTRYAVWMFVSVFSINTLFEVLILFFPISFIQTIGNMLFPLYTKYIQANLGRDRIFTISYSESYYPIILYAISIIKLRTHKVLLICLLLARSYITLVSKFRSLFIMMIISYTGSFIVFVKNQKMRSTYVLIVVALVLVSYVIFVASKQTIFDRLTLSSQLDIDTITYRVDQIPDSMYIATSSVIGVGLGNYWQYADTSNSYISDPRTREIYITDMMPHNYFLEKAVETGIVGFIVHLAFIGYFLYVDIRNSRQYPETSRVFSIAFWALFSYALFNPSYNLTYTTLFFVFRAMISGNYVRSIQIMNKA